MKTKIFVEVKTQWDRMDIYPQCELSKTLVKLTGKKSFNKAEIEVLKEAGFEIVVQAPKL